MEMNSIKYDKYILVTGGAGFMGSHMVIYLVNKYPNYFIVNLDKLCYNSCLKNLECLKENTNYKFIKGDVCDEEDMRHIFRHEHITSVIHFAALSHVDHSFSHALDCTYTNTFGTHVLAKTASEASVDRFILVSTDEVYGGDSTVPCTEHSPIKPSNPYACSKAASELMALSYLRCHQLPLIITRATNVYGPHKFPETVVPKFICLLLGNRKCCIHGNGDNIRHYLYVSDVIKAYDVILHEGCVGEVYNIGCDLKMSVLEVAEYLISKLKGSDATALTTPTTPTTSEHLEHTNNRAHNDHHYLMDCSKVHELSWRPEVSWERGVEMTVAWYKENSHNWPNLQDALKAFPSV